MNIKNKFLLGISMGFVAYFGMMSNVATADSTEVITGNTTFVENTQDKWMFNRDVSTSTPYNFILGNPSIGSGSVYVLPIGANAMDKFIGEYFVNSPITEIDSISYDFKIGASGDNTKKDHFYMNVYANFGSSDDLKFYDCRYNIVPAVGSNASYTTVTFDPDQSYPVAQRNTSPYTCPSIPSDMNTLSPGSNIRAFALNLGDTSINDAGLDGYFDNVKVDKTNGITTFDFEEYISPSIPNILTPANNAVVTSAGLVKVDWSNSTGSSLPITYQYESYTDAGYSSLIYSSSWLSDSEIPTPGTPIGDYYLRVRAKDFLGNISSWSNGNTNPHKVSVVASVNAFDVPAECNQNIKYNLINGTNGNDKIRGTGGNDMIYGKNGNDKIDGNGGNDCIVGGNGNDNIDGGGGEDVILGSNNNDVINGGSGNDTIYGQSGNDVLEGGSGNDLLDGGSNNDTAKGGTDIDTCIAENTHTCEL